MRKNKVEEVVNWAKKMGGAGIYNNKSANERIRSFKYFVSVLSDDDVQNLDYLLKNLDDIATRWATKNYATPSSIPQHKSNVKGLIQDYLKYQRDPNSLKPRVRSVKNKAAKAKAEPAQKRKKRNTEPPQSQQSAQSIEQYSFLPKLHIDIQIHISADAKAAQIDQIFKSMAEHLYNRKS